MRTQTIVPVTGLYALETPACFKRIEASVVVILTPVAIIAVGTLTRCKLRQLCVMANCTVLTRVVDFACNAVLTMFARVIFTALTPVAVVS